MSPNRVSILMILASSLSALIGCEAKTTTETATPTVEASASPEPSPTPAAATIESGGYLVTAVRCDDQEVLAPFLEDTGVSEITYTFTDSSFSMNIAFVGDDCTLHFNSDLEISVEDQSVAGTSTGKSCGDGCQGSQCVDEAAEDAEPELSAYRFEGVELVLSKTLDDEADIDGPFSSCAIGEVAEIVLLPRE